MTVISNNLVGPPEARQSTAGNTPINSTNFIKNIPISGPNSNTGTEPMKGLTENFSPTYMTSGDPGLDFFFQVVPGTSADTVTSLLSAAWATDPSTALRLMCNLRGVRGTGKSDREGFYASAIWLHSQHPKTLALNAGPISEFGYLKDMPEILHRIINGGSTRTRPRKIKAKPGRFNRRRFFGRPNRRSKADRLAQKNELSTEERIAADLEKGRVLSAAAAELRRNRRAEAARRAVERYNTDPNYRFLHDCTSDLFASLLSKDLQRLNSGKEHCHLSLAAKWCPSLDSAYDQSTLLCEAIARRLFPKDSDAEFATLSDEHYAYRARQRLRKVALVPLRRALQLPEVYIGKGDWGSIPYNRVASVAMKNYKEFFLKYDKERFERFLGDVKEGKAKIAAGALLPHEILQSDDEVADLQWERMVNDLLAKGKLSNCIAVCDVSGSMCGTPMEVCVALGLLVSELSEEPWHGRVITFSADPELHLIRGDTIKEKMNFVERMDWGMNTDFQKVFDKMLEVAVNSRLPPEKMVKRVFVFSDMEFDEASANPWETDYEAIKRKYEENGYGEAVPEMVFWNLRDSQSVPVTAGQKGVALVSGFSKNMLKLFLEGGGIVSPRAVMEQAISGKEYEKLKVFD
ncbi:plant/protein [Rhynchospora pubera]|uniref:Plant/protein n=1 Tax=Rhynchospora pubera TaxID=906938 RepID=A0AAV8CQG3_9POAL|nr:plant/protein [Rhynchospora pubera]